MPSEKPSHHSKFSKRLEQEIEQGRKIAENAENIWRYGSYTGILRANRRANFHIKYGQIDSSSFILEVGCGTGLITRRVAGTGAIIIATDLSFELIAQAQKLSANKNVVYQVANAEELPFCSEAFDAIIGNAILHHLDPSTALDEFWRVLKPEGRIVFTEPNMLNPQIALQKNWGWLKKKMGDTPDETAFFAQQVRTLLLRHRFSDLEVFPFDFLHPAIPKAFAIPIKRLGALLERVPLLREIAGSLLIVGFKK